MWYFVIISWSCKNVAFGQLSPWYVFLPIALGYPTLQFFVNGKSTEYTGGRNIEALKYFLSAERANIGDKGAKVRLSFSSWLTRCSYTTPCIFYLFTGLENIDSSTFVFHRRACFKPPCNTQCLQAGGVNYENNVAILTEDNFLSAVSAKPVAFVKFFAPWWYVYACGFCTVEIFMWQQYEQLGHFCSCVIIVIVSLSSFSTIFWLSRSSSFLFEWGSLLKLYLGYMCLIVLSVILANSDARLLRN